MRQHKWQQNNRNGKNGGDKGQWGAMGALGRTWGNVYGQWECHETSCENSRGTKKCWKKSLIMGDSGCWEGC